MKKTLNVLKTVAIVLLSLMTFGILIFTIISVNTFDRNDRNLFGYKAFIVLSDSMSATDFQAGDLVLSKEVDPATLQPGDIITFTSENTDNYGEVLTHKIRELTVDADGNPGFITYGTTTDTNDEGIVTYSDVIGQYQYAIPKVGYFFQFLKTVPGYILCIFVPFMLLILLQGLNCIQLFKQYKQEQLAELRAEREKIEAERAESQKMLKELMTLKAQLAAQQNSNAPRSSRRRFLEDSENIFDDFDS